MILTYDRQNMFIIQATGDVIFAKLGCVLNEVIFVYIGNNQLISL